MPMLTSRSNGTKHHAACSFWLLAAKEDEHRCICLRLGRIQNIEQIPFGT